MKRLFLIGMYFLLTNSLAFAEPAVQPENNTEISVNGDAPYNESPNWVSFSLRISQTSVSAVEAANSLNQRVEKLQAAVRPIDPKATVRFRSDEYGTPASSIKSDSPLTITRTLQIGTPDTAKLPQLVDLAGQQAGSQVQSVYFEVRNSGQELLDAIAAATERAKVKAQLVAKTMGVNLGQLISAVVTEEPEGEALRERLTRGGESLQYGDKQLRVFVTVRYAIGK